MPSFTMHIAIANEYIRKHKNEIKNIKEFVKGNIYPDFFALIASNAVASAFALS